jgi:GT2 family glycosyltransferase
MTNWTTSVIIATLNSEKTLERCLQSVIPYVKRGYVKEIIIVDGGSKDNTIAIAKRFPTKLMQDTGSGVGQAWDLGARHATGDFLFFLDSDQCLGYDFFPKVYHFFNKEEVGVLGCASKVVVTNKITATASQWPRWYGAQPVLHMKQLFVEGHRYGPGGLLFIRRSAFNAVNGWSGLSNLTISKVPDIAISEKIKRNGWETANPETGGYWLQAPLYEFYRESPKTLIKQQFLYGMSAAGFHYEVARDLKLGPLFVLIRLFSFPMSLILALRYRNVLHILLDWPPRIAWVFGFLAGLHALRKITYYSPKNNQKGSVTEFDYRSQTDPRVEAKWINEEGKSGEN